jgi:hypothetical protein
VLGEIDCVQFMRDTFVLLRAFLTPALGNFLPVKDGQSIALNIPCQGCFYTAARDMTLSLFGNACRRVDGRAAIVSSLCGPKKASISTLAALVISTQSYLRLVS